VNARTIIQTARCQLLLRRSGVRASRVTCEGKMPRLNSAGRVELGRVALRGIGAPPELGAEAGASLVIGDRVFINQGATIVASTAIRIGDDVRIGDYAAVYDSSYHAVEEGAEVSRAPVSIGRNAWLARGAIVLPGVTVGEHAVVAAGSVVVGDVPARTLVAGNPARVVRELSASEEWRRA
jgi:acetyltransferase-like isoleucine patch superfamily enzyme